MPLPDFRGQRRNKSIWFNVFSGCSSVTPNASISDQIICFISESGDENSQFSIFSSFNATTENHTPILTAGREICCRFSFAKTQLSHIKPIASKKVRSVLRQINPEYLISVICQNLSASSLFPSCPRHINKNFIGFISLYFCVRHLFCFLKNSNYTCYATYVIIMPCIFHFVNIKLKNPQKADFIFCFQASRCG